MFFGFLATVLTLAVRALFALMASSMRTRLLPSQQAMRWMRRAFAASFAALGRRPAKVRA